MLNVQQQKAFDLVKNGLSVFITGSPGTGKSFLVKELVKYLISSNKKYAITSSTGCSATLISGQTIHSFIGLGVYDTSIDKTIANIKKYKTKYNKIKEINVLIIDEISMIDDKTLNNISDILKNIKDNKKEFGGIQIIFIGDFCQLSPVSGDFCFKSNSWINLNPICINLTELIRQKDDTEFQKVLQEIRFGKCSKNTKQILKNMENTKFNKDIKPTRLYSLNSDVQQINDFEYRSLYKKKHKKDVSSASIIQCFPYQLKFNDEYDYENNIQYEDIDDNIDIFRYNPTTNDKNTNNLKEYSIDLYKGLYVMITRNINVEDGLTNGTTGNIIELTPNCVTIESNNKRYVIYYYVDKNENNGIYHKFMPIKLAYALSIHKSQGATLNAIEVDGSTSIFAPGQIYTAISRAKNTSSIRLINFDTSSIICNSAVKTFYQDIAKS